MTRRTGNLELVDRDVLEIHPDDAARLWISDGDADLGALAASGGSSSPPR